AAAGALLRYIKETQFGGVKRICALSVYNCRDFLMLPDSCKRNLELTETMRGGERRGSLLWAIDRTATSMGRRLLRAFLEKPLLDVQQINARLDGVEEFYNNSVLSGQLTDSLKGVYDIERLMTRIMYDKCTPRDLVSFAATSLRLTEIKALGQGFRAPLLKKLAGAVDTLEDLRREIVTTIDDDPPALLKDGGYIRAGRSAEIDELREILHNSKSYLSRLEQSTKEKTGIKNLRIGYNRVFGYYFEVSKSNVEMVPDNFVRKQTLTTGERYITEELKELESKILSAGERLQLLERELFDGVCKKLSDNLLRVQNTAYAVAYLDVLCAMGELARDSGFTRPYVDDSDEIRIENGRHPVVERVLRDELFVPNDTLLDCGSSLVNIVTGPNMSGKSTYMRQVALIVIMAQMGAFVPATLAHIGVVDAVFTRVGASDDLFAGDSTFMVEMKEVAEILQDATAKSLVILDEIGRGTSTFDGMSIARAVVEHICKDGGIGCKTMFATHYHELTEMDADFANVRNYNIAVRKTEEGIRFLRRIVEGPADDSYGIEVAQLAGVPKAVTERANEILRSLEEENPQRIERRVVTTKNEKDSVLVEELRRMHIEAITPLEAMSELDRLIKLARSREEN
ncbi:MAG: DNA mismatch repair protein MutS, partial [Oscillospiraceae bacterium]|nr:DNA mismatch repair protein MutS [Oscillospiraceae bacterium]